MLYFIGFIAMLFLIFFLETIQRIVNDPKRYAIPTIITSFLGAFLLILILDKVS